MALYLGRVGRKILNYVTASPRLERLVINPLSNAAGKITGGRFTPGLTREMFRLSRKIGRDGDLIFKSDGIYNKENFFLLVNPIGKLFPQPIAVKIDVSSPEGLVKYTRTIKKVVRDYRQKFGKPDSYVLFVLPRLLEKCGGIEELKEWDITGKELISDYHQKFGELDFYILFALPRLLEKCGGIEELKTAKELISDYRQKFGEPYFYVLSVPSQLLEKCGGIEELKIAKEIISDYSRKFGDPSAYVRDALPQLLGKCGNKEDVRFILKLSEKLISANINPSPLAEILSALGENWKEIINGNENKFIRFCKQSNSNLPNNLDFFKILTPENAGRFFDESANYFQAMKTSLFLPLLFKEFAKRDRAGRDKLAFDFLGYYSGQVRGETVPASELTPAIKEEVGYALVGLASLSRGQYKETLDRAKDQKIPARQFDQITAIELKKSQKKGQMTKEEVEFLRERIGWLEEAVELGKKIIDIEEEIENFPPTDRPGKKPSEGHTEKYLKLHLLKSYRGNPTLKEKVDNLINNQKSIDSSNIAVPQTLREVFNEIKPEAKEEVRRRIDGLVNVPRLDKITGRFS